ncbi:MAG: RNA polymerase sigma factor [Blastocatellia bacterium]|nr:RNA polymerase sigma factor [Blastocatellia bacterium]
MISVSAQLSDEELLQRMLNGDEAAFSELYERRQGSIYRFALRMSGSEAVAEDVTQEVFLLLIRDGAQFDPARGTVAAYLYGIARHQILHRLERDRSFVTLEQDDSETGTLDERWVQAEGPLAEYLRRESVETLRQAVMSLPPHYREVVVMCDLQEMSYVETAAVVGCPVGTVRSRLHRAHEELLKRLQAKPAAADQSAFRLQR